MNKYIKFSVEAFDRLDLDLPKRKVLIADSIRLESTEVLPEIRKPILPELKAVPVHEDSLPTPIEHSYITYVLDTRADVIVDYDGNGFYVKYFYIKKDIRCN